MTWWPQEYKGVERPFTKVETVETLEWDLDIFHLKTCGKVRRHCVRCKTSKKNLFKKRLSNGRPSN